MATYSIPTNAGRFTVVVAAGGHFAVWNGKQKKQSVHIPVRTMAQAKELCEKLNRRQHNGKIEVW